MKKRTIGFWSAIFGILGFGAAVLGIFLALTNRNAGPVLVEQPQAAKEQVVSMLDALCAGDYETVSACLSGKPNLGLGREAEDRAGQLIWEALAESFAYELEGDFYATESGVAQNVTISCLDISSVTEKLGDRAKELLEQRVRAAEDPDEVYDENNEYREDVVMDVLYTAVQEALEEDTRRISWELTLNLVYENGQWWIMPEDALLKAISGGVLN